jgi:hypothetical protein
MKLSKTTIIIPIFSALALYCLSCPAPTHAQLTVDPAFNPNKILSDGELLNYNAMNLLDIQNFLQSKNSFLANYSTTNTNGVVKSAAQIIYDATHNNYDCDGVTLSTTPTETEKSAKCLHITTVNPKVILVLLQKEESLIEDSNPPQSHLDWAAGYGCPDGWVCNPYYKGFGKQVNSAALQFLAYMNNPGYYTYKAGQTYTISNTLNPYCTNSNQTMSISPQNQETAALYNYTPHVFNGNYNFYQLWNRYFPAVLRIYPNGSIIQATGDSRVWLIENGRKRLFDNWSAFTSRFKPEQIVKVNTSDLDNYPVGDEIKFANYSVVQTPDKKLYLIVDQTKRPFANQTVFKNIGFNPAEIQKASSTDLTAYQTGATITATSTYVTGALLQNSKTGEIYYVQDGKRALVDKILLPIKFSFQKATKVSPKELNNYATTTPVLLDEGTLVQTANYPIVYLISGGKKRPFADPSVFTKLNYDPANVITISSQFLYNYDLGDPIQ